MLTTKILDELKETLATMPNDAMLRKYNIDRRYQVIIPDKIDWETVLQ